MVSNADLASLTLLIVPTPGKPRHDSPPAFHDIDDHGLYFGGQLRLTAAARFSLQYQPPAIIVVGGLHPDKPCRQTVAAKEFILAANPGATVTEINSLPCTRHNVIALFNQCAAQLRSARVGILTNRYHLPRFLEFWSTISRAAGLDLPAPAAIPAESLVETGHDSLYAAAYQQRLRAEAEGVAHWRAGQYVDACLPKLRLFADELARRPEWYLAPDERKLLNDLSTASGAS